jgi:ankyrin repeat protein
VQASAVVSRFDRRNEDGETPLQIHASAGCATSLKECLVYGADTEARGGEEERPALIRAAAIGHGGIIHALIAAKANVNARDGDGDTALIWSAFLGHTDLVRQLHAARADLNAQGAGGFTALSQAVTQGRLATARLLLELRADPTLTTATGQTAVACAETTTIALGVQNRQEMVALLRGRV